MRKLEERGWIWLVFVLIMIIILMFAYTYLKENWEERWGGKAETFCNFSVINQEKEIINNKTHYKVNFKLFALKSMYRVKISIKNSTNITKITSPNEELPTARTIQARTTVYPTMTVQLDNNTFYGQVEMQISFLDVEGDEKNIYKIVPIGEVPPPRHPIGLRLDLFLIAGLLAIVYILRKRR